MKKRTLFIINPVSGGKTKDGVPELIQKYVDSTIFEFNTAFSNGVAHARQLAKEASTKYDIIVAVGGDGTVNEVASAIAGTDTILGIIPYGSGNGLSRFLGVPMDAAGAFKTFNNVRVIGIDAAKMNGQWFFNMAGMGFDAHISHVFAHGSKKRGFFSYLKSSLLEVSRYRPQNYQIIIDGKLYEREAFMLSFANSSQYGNNAHVSPYASVQDGLLDVCIIKPFPIYRFPEMGIRMFTKTADRSEYVEIIRGKHIQVKRTQPGPVHLDGEPQMAGNDIEVDIKPNTLNVIAGSTYQS